MTVLERALHSVYQQTHAATQVIVVDDGSTDATPMMLCKKFPQVEYYQQTHTGVSAARNRGISMARGQWLAFLDSDDEWLNQKLQLQFASLQATPAYKICHTEEIWKRNGIRVNAMKKHAKKGGWIYQDCLPLCRMSPSSIIIHRTVFEHIGLFDETLPACEDYDLWLRITACYPVLFLQQPLIIKQGGHEDQLSKKYWGMDRFRIRALHKMLQTNTLTASDRQATINMLVKKVQVYQIGALKRNKRDEAAYYQQLISPYINEAF